MPDGLPFFFIHSPLFHPDSCITINFVASADTGGFENTGFENHRQTIQLYI